MFVTLNKSTLLLNIIKYVALIRFGENLRNPIFYTKVNCNKKVFVKVCDWPIPILKILISSNTCAINNTQYSPIFGFEFNTITQ